MVDVSVWDIAKIKDDLFDLNDNKSLLPVLEGTVLITSVINKILSKSIYNNLYLSMACDL
jgi:hypothetical protein